MARSILRHPERGVVELAYASFAVAGQPERTLVVYVDQDRS